MSCRWCIGRSARRGVPIHTLQRVTAFDGEAVTIADVYSGARKAPRLPIAGHRRHARAAATICITRSSPAAPISKSAGIAAVTRIGDALAPGAIVHAVHSGHRYAREFDAMPAAAPYTRDFPL